jgi:hypothetical protein
VEGGGRHDKEMGKVVVGCCGGSGSGSRVSLFVLSGRLIEVYIALAFLFILVCSSFLLIVLS